MTTTENWFNLTGKTCLITGAGYGLGRALVYGMAAHGARVIGLARSAEALKDTFDVLGDDHRYLVGDLLADSVYEDLEGLGETVDILVNNAGGDPFSRPWPQQTPEEWRLTFDVNVGAAERLCRLFAPSMMRQGWGRIINIASVYGTLGQDSRNTLETTGAGAYVAAKHAMVGLTNYLACQVADRGVTVNTLSPGMIPWWESTPERQRLWDALAEKTPVKRNGTPDDFVTAVVFLASPQSGFVNGSNLVVGGGWSIW
ncbi:MAG: SDR family NAD(P)-dependent oxidoreductase [Acidobacteria bacterium]|nr:SDR family NAD(P)-dependent oxidoreductase [Acidobacteriota bacterium]